MGRDDGDRGQRGHGDPEDQPSIVQEQVSGRDDEQGDEAIGYEQTETEGTERGEEHARTNRANLQRVQHEEEEQQPESQRDHGAGLTGGKDPGGEEQG